MYFDDVCQIIHKRKIFFLRESFTVWVLCLSICVFYSDILLHYFYNDVLSRRNYRPRHGFDFGIEIWSCTIGAAFFFSFFFSPFAPVSSVGESHRNFVILSFQKLIPKTKQLLDSKNCSFHTYGKSVPIQHIFFTYFFFIIHPSIHSLFHLCIPRRPTSCCTRLRPSPVSLLIIFHFQFAVVSQEFSATR
jgi:hypothetical protein